MTDFELEGRREHIRSLRRLLTSGSAMLSVSPFLQATAPRLLPSAVAALGAVWAAMTCVLVAVAIEELLLWRQQRRATACRARSSAGRARAEPRA